MARHMRRASAYWAKKKGLYHEKSEPRSVEQAEEIRVESYNLPQRSDSVGVKGIKIMARR